MNRKFQEKEKKNHQVPEYGNGVEKVLVLCESCRMRSSWTDRQNRPGFWCSFLEKKSLFINEKEVEFFYKLVRMRC